MHIGVFAAARVVLLLVVAPAACARTDFERPLRGVDGIELVVPQVG